MTGSPAKKLRGSANNGEIEVNQQFKHFPKGGLARANAERGDAKGNRYQGIKGPCGQEAKCTSEEQKEDQNALE